MRLIQKVNMANRGNTPHFRRNNQIIGLSAEEAEKVAGLRASWAEADQKRTARTPETPPAPYYAPKSNGAIIRRVGALSTELANRHDLFIQTLRSALPRRLWHAVKPAGQLFAPLMVSYQVGRAAQELGLPSPEAIDLPMLRLPERALATTTGKVTDVVYRPIYAEEKDSEPITFKDLSLKIDSSAAQAEAAALGVPEFEFIVPLIKPRQDAHFTEPQQAFATAITREAFMGQVLSFGKVEPVYGQ